MSRRSVFRSARGRFLIAGLLGSLVSAANAGFVTTNEAGMDSVFSQGSFGSTPVDIRFNPVQTIHNTALLVIDADDDAELYQLSSIAGANRSVGMFFVDSIGFCGVRTTSTVGCALTPGNLVVLNSTYAADTSIGANLASHELGHAAGLFHVSDANNLMNSFITAGNSVLIPTQVSTILNSALVQIDSVTHQRFISITPYEVLADVVSNVPEPGTWLMASVGLTFIAGAVRRAKTP